MRVLVCDDGSSDDSVTKVQNLFASRRTKIQTLIFPGEHRGAAAARNRGIEASRADVIFFLGADIILRPGALAAHLSFHEQHSEDAAALGFVVWDPRVVSTPLMEWMMHGGQQNNFDEILGADTADAEHFFYGSHISLKRVALGDIRFSEEYTRYGHEDKDIGYRFKNHNLALHVLHNAVGLHAHHYTAQTFFARQYAVGSGQRILNQRIGALDPRTQLKVRHWLQYILYPLGLGAGLRAAVRYLAPRYATPRLFAHVANYEYRRGLFHTEHTSYPQVFPQ